MGDKDEVLEAVVKEAVDLVPSICFFLYVLFFLIVLFEFLFVLFSCGFMEPVEFCRRTCRLKRFFRP